MFTNIHFSSQVCICKYVTQAYFPDIAILSAEYQAFILIFTINMGIDFYL